MSRYPTDHAGLRCFATPVLDPDPAQTLLRKQLEALGLGQLLPAHLPPGPFIHGRHREVRRRWGTTRWRTGAARWPWPG